MYNFSFAQKKYSRRGRLSLFDYLPDNFRAKKLIIWGNWKRLQSVAWTANTFKNLVVVSKKWVMRQEMFCENTSNMSLNPCNHSCSVASITPLCLSWKSSIFGVVDSFFYRLQKVFPKIVLDKCVRRDFLFS